MAMPQFDDGENRPPSRFVGAVEAKVAAALARGACLTARQIAERIGASPGSVTRVLNKMLAAGKADAWKAHPRDRAYIWASEDQP